MRRRFRSLVALSLTLSLSACSLFSGKDEDARVPKPLVGFDSEVDVERVWSIRVGEQSESGSLVPLVLGENLYVVGDSGRVIALSLDGKKLWEKRLDLRLSSGIAASDGKLFLGTIDGSVVVLQASNGELLWSTRVSSELISSPQIEGSVVVVQTVDDTLTALDTEDGRPMWTQEHAQPPLTLRGSSTPMIEAEAVFVGLASGEAKAYRVDNGELLWSSRIAQPQGSSELERMVDIKAQPLLLGETLFMVSFQGSAVAMNMYTGQVRWRREFSSYQSISEGFGSIYLSNDRSHVNSLDQRTGEISWRQDQLEYRKLTAPVRYSSYIAVGDFEGYVHLLSQVDGEFVGRFKAGDTALRQAPVVAGDVLYTLDADGKLSAFREK